MRYFYKLVIYEGYSMGKVIAIASGKGGTGKTTICVNLGTALTRRGHSVLLVDCDSGMRGLDIMLGISKSLVYDISDAICGNCTAEQVIYPCSHIENLSLIPAPNSAKDKLSPAVLTQYIQTIKDKYDYIIIDAPAGLGKGFETTVAPADLCLVVANPEPTSIRGCVNVRKLLSAAGKKDIRLVINRFSRSTFKELHFYEDLDRVIDEAGIQLIAIISENRQVISAIQKGTAYKGKCTALSAIERLAARIDGETKPLLIY